MIKQGRLTISGGISRLDIKRIFIKFKSGRTSEVDIRVVDNIVDTKP